jgi:SAM-dependent methyltransferase
METRLREQRKWKPKGALETIPCNFCGSTEFSFYREENSFTLVRCLNCGLVFVNPRPSTEEMAEFYKQYFPENSAEMWERENLANFIRDAEFLDRESPKGNKKAFEVGAGFGFFLRELKKRGFEVDGLDLSPSAAAYAKKELGIDLVLGDFCSAQLPDKRYDAMASFFVLEHVRDPACMLRRIKSMLKPGGVMMLSVPNHTFFQVFAWLDWLAKFRPAAYLIEKGRAETAPDTAFNVVDPPAHLFSYTAPVLRDFLAREGFIDIRVFNGKMFKRGTALNWMADSVISAAASAVALFSAGEIIISPVLKVFARKRA